MMKYYNFLILITVIYSCNLVGAQNNFAKLYFYDECIDSIVAYNYTLYGEHDEVFESDKDSTFFQLDTNTIYIIFPKFFNEEDSFYRYVFYKPSSANLEKQDTLYIAGVGAKSVSKYGHGPINKRFYKCGKLCDGEVKCYYSNGVIASLGIYKNGYIEKEILYNENGSIKELNYYSLAFQEKGYWHASVPIKHITYEYESKKTKKRKGRLISKRWVLIKEYEYLDLKDKKRVRL